MDHDEGQNMASLYENNGELLVALTSFAPSGNVRIAMIQLVDFLVDLEDDAEIDVRVILEIISRGIVRLGFTDPEQCDHDHADVHADERLQRGYEDLSELTPEETLAHFREQLGLEEEDED